MEREPGGWEIAVRAAGGLLLMLLAAAAIAAGAFALGLGEREPLDVRVAGIADAGASAGTAADPLAWRPGRDDELAERAATASSHVIYAKSPGGAVASARRTANWREEVDAAAAQQGVDAATLEAIVLLESAGRPEVSAGGTPESASGLAQILPSTATELLGMRVDLAESIALTERIARAKTAVEAARLRRRRAEVDQRFDPVAAVEGAATYLAIAERRFGSEELAVVSYHMGIGNLEDVVRAYAGAEGDAAVAPLVAAEELSYAQIYFDSAPDRNRDAYELLRGFGDESADYVWKVRAAETIMRLYRDDREELERVAELATAKATLEEVFHPEDETEVFEDPGDVEAAIRDGDLVPLPSKRSLGWDLDPQLGELASELDEPRELYRALRPEALATLGYIAARVRDLSGARRPLRVTSAVRDRSYQSLLTEANPEATEEYSLHTTGWSFDIRRDYASARQAAAFQHVLDRLSALAVIDYAVEPGAIHVTVSNLGAELLP